MNLEQIVKETVAKMVDEKHLTAAEKKKKEDIVMAMKKDFKGPAAAMYAIATDKAKKLAEDGIDEARVSQDNVVDYLANSLTVVWNAGKSNNSIDFQDFAQSLYFDLFGDDEMNEANLGHNESSSIEQEGRFWIITYQTADGTKEKSFESEDEARKFYNTLDESQESNNDKITKYEKYTYTLDGEAVKPEITFLNNILKATIGNKIYNIGAPKDGKVELTPESGKKGTYTESTELDEFVVRRWQHYAGIK